MKYLVIANKGEINIDALTLLGASTKREDKTKIGMFGSGNKYALAYFLRNNYQVKIFSGEKEIKLSLEETDFGGHKFNVIYVDGQRTSITTDFGHKWELWQAIRELYSNAQDEGKIRFEILDFEDDEPFGVDDQSMIYISADSSVENFMYSIDDYIADGLKVKAELSDGVTVYQKHSNKSCVYRKGILCYSPTKNSLFDYDIDEIEVNEDRLAKHSHIPAKRIWEALYKCDDVNLLKVYLSAMHNDMNLWESTMDHYHMYWDACPVQINKAWGEAIGNKVLCPYEYSGYVEDSQLEHTLFVPRPLYLDITRTVWGAKFKSSIFNDDADLGLYKIKEPTEEEEEIIKKVNYFFDECNYPIKYNLLVADFDSMSVSGGIVGPDLLIDKSQFRLGPRHIAIRILNFQSKQISDHDHWQIENEFINYIGKNSSIIL